MAPQQGPTAYHDNGYPILDNLTACHLDSYMAAYVPCPPLSAAGHRHVLCCHMPTGTHTVGPVLSPTLLPPLSD